MKKSIIHSDINSNNFFVKKTKKEILTIDINDMSYNIKLVGYC
jgi:Ser/Thr protein kinase RdoA (MazF antagonist)